MPCYAKNLPDGIRWMCGTDLEMPHCADCLDYGDYLCDFPVGQDKTCDRPMCQAHATAIGPNLHYCQTHAKMWQEFVDSGGVNHNLENVVPFRRVPVQ